MEQFVLGIFQEQLAKFIIGFKKEQVNANLLNGKGEIHNVELNCSVLNETISRITPYVELERVHVSKLAFHVTSWTNLRKAPILIEFEHIQAHLVEPLHYLDPSQRKSVQQITKLELLRLMQQGLRPLHRGPYNLFDRILDNLAVEIRSLQIRFQPRGKFKTRISGPWTPPALELQLASIKFVSVNEYGQEGSPDEVWKHNHHRTDGTIFIFKKLSMEYQFSLRPASMSKHYQDAAVRDTADSGIPLISGLDNKVELQIAIQRRHRDGEILAVQMDMTIPKVEVNIASETVPLLAHAVAGITYCMAKDRAFVDPLKSGGKKSTSSSSDESGTPVQVIVETSSFDMDERMREEDDEEAEEAIQKEELAGSTHGDTEQADLAMSVDDAGSVSSDDEAVIAPAGSDIAAAEPSTPTPTKMQAPQPGTPSYDDQPVICFPNGLVIHERLTVSAAIHHVSVRGTYAPSTDGHLQVVAKGCIAEAIWPKISKEKGGYLQASVSYISVQERFGQRVRTVLAGGIQYEDNGPLERTAKPLGEVGRDETFPFYEDRAVRPDPIGLRHTFPAQAFGLKTTVEFVKMVTESAEANAEQVKVLHEVGIDRFEVILDSLAWCRALRFALNADGGGFDPRWHSGDWSEYLTADMLVRPSVLLNLADCTQPGKQILLDENEFVSSDLFNVTARSTNVVIKVPAAITEDVRSCDVVLRLDEATMVVSSALPRTFLSGRIGSSVYGEDSSNKGLITFPNDPSDISYLLERTEDPSNRQRGILTSRRISTFRMQLSIRGISLRLVPVISFNVAPEPQQLVCPAELTMIICFEGTPPESPDSNETKIVFFTSILVHRFEVNLDLDLLAAGVGTVAWHVDAVGKMCSASLKLFSDYTPSLSEVRDGAFAEASSEGVEKRVKGRRVQVRKQLQMSRVTGGLSLAFCLQVAESAFCLWRQNVPRYSPLRPPLRADSRQPYVPLLKLLEVRLGGFELGVEGTFRGPTRRLVAKMCLSTASISICEICNSIQSAEGRSMTAEESLNSHQLVEVVSLGKHRSAQMNSKKGGNMYSECSMAFRIEEQLGTSHSLSVSADLANSNVDCRVDDIEGSAHLVLEALLMPAWSSSRTWNLTETKVSRLFPEGTVGALLCAFAALIPSVDESRWIDVQVQPTSVESVERVPGRKVDSILRSLISHSLPDDIEIVMLRLSLSSMLIHVPSHLGSTKLGGFGFYLEHTDFLATYFASTSSSWDAPLCTIAQQDEPWSSLVDKMESGLRHRLKSRQALLSVQFVEGTFKAQEEFVPAFDFAYAYGQSRAAVSLTEGLSVNNVEMLEDFQSCLDNFKDRANQVVINANSLVSALKGQYVKSDTFDSQRSPIGMACSSAAVSIQSVRKVVRGMREKLGSYENSIRSQITEKQNNLDKMRMLLFEKERERLGAIALTSSDATGWLRVGSPQRTGLRGLMSCTLVPHWAILKQSFLLFYNGPGQYNLVHLLSLEGGSLRELAGSRRKGDLKRAFAIVDQEGTIAFVIAGSDSEYFSWVRALRNAVQLYSPLGVSDAARKDLGLSSEGATLSSAIEQPSLPGPQEASQGDSSARPLGRTFRAVHGAVRAAKATGQAVVDTGRRVRESSRVSNLSSHGTSTGEGTKDFSINSPSPMQDPAITISTKANNEAGVGQIGDATILADSPGTRGQQFRNRFAGVGKVTKSTFGSAIQAARQKGREVVERRRGKLHDSELSIHEGIGAPPVFDGVDSEWRKAADIDDVEGASDFTSHAEWACSHCTFANSPLLDRCEMCNYERVESIPTIDGLSHETVSNSVFSDNHNADEQTLDSTAGKEQHETFCDPRADAGEIPGSRLSVRGRLGAAVRSVRIGKQMDGGPTETETSKANQGFVFRRRISNRAETSDNAVPGAHDTIKLKNVTISGPLTIDHPFANQLADVGIPLKRLHGQWFVKVQTNSAASEKEQVTHPISSADNAENEGSEKMEVGTDFHTSGKEVDDKADPGEMVGNQYALETMQELSPPIEKIKDEIDALPTRNFRITVHRQDRDTDAKSAPVSEIEKSFTDILALHTALSESIARVAATASSTIVTRTRSPSGQMPEPLSRSLGLSPLDTIRLTGKLLAGLMETSEQDDASQAAVYGTTVIAEFLNSALDCALPVDGLAVLTEFLGVVDTSTRNESARFDDSSFSKDPLRSQPASDLFRLVSLCDAELLRAENHSLLAERLSHSATQERGQEIHAPLELYEQISPHTASGKFQEAMHLALMKVMEERDEAHARMVAAGVLHVHEMEQMRKKSSRLASQLEDIKKNVANSGGPFRNDQEEQKRESEKLMRLQREMQQNSDAELISLCQQLAGEISARTSTALEVVRLKESRKIERETEATEKQALKDEINRLKEMLGEERKKTAVARRESGTWRESFEEIIVQIQHDATVADTSFLEKLEPSISQYSD